MKVKIVFAAVMALCLAGFIHPPIAASLPVPNICSRHQGTTSPISMKWLYLATNLLVDANVDSDIQIVTRASHLGYNGVMVADSKFCRWDNLPAHYLENCTRFRSATKALGMKFIATVVPIGYSNDLLSKDVNLAEGLPVIDAPFEATNDGHLVPVSENLIKNGNFESTNGPSPAGWDWVDQPGKICVLEGSDSPEGRACLRMSDISKYDPTNGHARAEETLSLSPFRNYHVSCNVKTLNFETPGNVQIVVLGEDGSALQYSTLPVKSTMPWQPIDVTFNSLSNSKVTFYIGVWGGKGGTIWWDNVKVEPAGLVNMIRRPGAPFKITSLDGKTIYIEDRDFSNAKDPLLGTNPWPGSYDSWHQAPVVDLPSDSRIRPGEIVKVSYYNMATVYDGQVTMCMSEPKTMQLLKWQMDEVRKNLHPDGYMLSYDEIRVGGWDQSCLDSKLTSGEQLAKNARECIQYVKEIDPGKQILVWSDMFDPTHNAQPKGTYYLVKGDGPWDKSWLGLDKDVDVVNWQSNPVKRVTSMEHFAKLGCHQILAGYYDGSPDSIKSWLSDAAKVSGVDGVMYTTWIGNYSDLAAFMKAMQ